MQVHIRGETIIILRFERRVCRWEPCRMHQFTGMWFNPNGRGSRLGIRQPWGCKSSRADQFGLSTGRASLASVLIIGINR